MNFTFLTNVNRCSRALCNGAKVKFYWTGAFGALKTANKKTHSVGSSFEEHLVQYGQFSAPSFKGKKGAFVICKLVDSVLVCLYL